MSTHSRLCKFVLAFALTLLQAPLAWAVVDVDLELVLAVDISMSMDPDEQRLQREGYIAALRDPTVMKAIKSGQRGRIAVTYLEWAGPPTQKIIVPWRLIDSTESAEAFISELAGTPYSRASMTSISAALLFARQQFEKGEFRSQRKVIDVSGDGVNNAGPLMSVVQPDILSSGIVINKPYTF